MDRRAVGRSLMAAFAWGAHAGRCEPVALPALVARSKPSVVLVGTYAETDSPRFQFRGTGFAVADGSRIVTNAHVLPELSGARPGRVLQLQVWRPEGGWEARAAELLSLQRTHDLALLRVAGPALPPLPLAAPDSPGVEGSDIAFIGFPIGGLLGYSHVTHRGLLSAVTQIAPPQPQARALQGAAIRQLREGSFEIYQLDAVAYPGNSGGPVFDLRSGQVIGVINMVLTKASREAAMSTPSGIAYAIPVARVHELLAR